MKLLTILTCLLILTSCMPRRKVYIQNTTIIKEVPVPENTENSPENQEPEEENEEEPEVTQFDFSGYFYLTPNVNNCLHLDLIDDLYNITIDCQQLEFYNIFDDSTGHFPLFSKNDLEIVDGEIKLQISLNYSKGHNLLTNNGDLLKGKFITEITLRPTDNKLDVIIAVYNSNDINNLGEIAVTKEFYEID